jgi:acetate kinase
MVKLMNDYGFSLVFIKPFEEFYNELKNRNLVNDDNPIFAIGLRLVAPGMYFLESHLIDAEFIEKLDIVAKSDPVHIEPVQKEIQSIKNIFPDTKIVAVSDSSFHATMPDVARRYAIPNEIAKEKDIYRFGFHGV